MKKQIAAALTGLMLLGSAAYAHEGGEDHEKKEKEHFQAMKQDMVKEFDAQISALQKVRNCVDAATDHAGVKKCREDEQAARKAFFETKKQQRIKEIEQRQKELDSEKQELQKTESKP
jgi:hypothetical protein